MKTRILFAHNIDRLDEAGKVIEHLAGIESFELADAAYRAAVKLWPSERIVLRHEARVIHDSARTRLA